MPSHIGSQTALGHIPLRLQYHTIFTGVKVRFSLDWSFHYLANSHVRQMLFPPNYIFVSKVKRKIEDSQEVDIWNYIFNLFSQGLKQNSAKTTHLR